MRLGRPVVPANDMGGGTESKTTTTIPEKGDTEKRADELTLKQLERQEATSERFGPIVDRYMQDLIDEQTVRGGGTLAPIRRTKKGGKSLADLEAEITDQINASHIQQYGIPFTESGDTAGVAKQKADIKAFAARQFEGQSEVDTEATEARDKRYRDMIGRETTQLENQDRMNEINRELAEINLETVKRGGKATDEQIALINEATGAAQKTGEADIERFRTATLRQINEEVASASGLRPTDTPVLRLSERAGEESTRQQGILTSKLAETNAMARLNFPMASAKISADISGQQQSLAEASRQFSESLNMRAQDNRMRLFAGSASPQISSAGFASSLAGERLRSGTQTTTSEKDMGLSDIGSLAGGVGGIMKAASLFSDRRLKRDIVRVGELLPGVGWYSYRYSWDAEKSALRYGVMADELERILPEAVMYDSDGYARVDYGQLFSGRDLH